MLKFVALVLVAVCAVAQEVKVSYDQNVLYLLYPAYDKNIGAVVFTYADDNGKYQVKGVQTSEGWEYKAEAKLSGSIYAMADVYDLQGMQYQSTPMTTFTQAVSGVALPNGRQIRAVTFHDDFNSFNTGSWKYEVSMFGGMNWEFQVYTPESKNVYTQGGSLYVKPTFTVDDPRWDENFLHSGVMDVNAIWGYCTNDGNYGCFREGQYGMLPPIMSGKVISIPTLRFGEIEVRARIPRGDWLWPAIWMMPRDAVYGGWPRSGEIDIMESRGNNGDIGVGTVSSTLHWGPAWDQNRYDLTHGERHTGSWANDYHTWRLEWTTDHIRTFVDNQQIFNVNADSGFWNKGGFGGSNIWASGTNMAPFDQDFFLMFNVAVGGTNGFFPDGANWGTTKPWANNSPHAAEDFWNGRGTWGPTWQGDNVAMLVDWVEFRS